MFAILTVLKLCMLLLLLHLSAGVIVFQQPSTFGTMQIQLTTTAGFISTATSNTFTYSNPGYDSITALGLALCGYDIQNPMALQFRAESSFDSSANSIVILILPLSTTKLAFINYYLIIVTAQVSTFLTIQNTCILPASPFNQTMFNRAQNYQLISPFPINGTSKVTGMPFIRSVNNVVASSYNSLQITGMTAISGSGVFNLTLFNNYSYQSEVCLSVLYYWDTQGLKLNLLNASYSNNFLTINSSSSTLSLASVSQLNFTLNSMYGPVFNRKCLVGFQSFRMGASIRQTVSFNLTGNGIYGIVSSSNYVVNYAWFCMAMITCQGTLSQYYPAINDCEAPCTINNCTICQTSTSCSQCGNGFYLNTLYRCNDCMANCVGCVNAAACSTCAYGFYYNGSSCVTCAQFCLSCVSGSCRLCQAGYYANGFQCIKCSSVLPNCVSCVTGTTCASCPEGYYSSGNSNGCIQCSTVLVGCNTCALALICSTCKPGFYLSGSSCRNCTATVSPACCGYFIANCSVCKNETACTLCAMGFYLASGSTQSCLSCGGTLSNCISCSGPSTCLLCSTTYFLNQYSQCVSCNSSISQCATCSNSSACLYCQLPFLMVNGTCLNCPIWPTRGLYFLDLDNVCQPCWSANPNCILCTQTTCTQCSDLYFLTSNNNNCNLCADYLPNCLSCNSAAACTVCVNGYFPNLNSSSVCSSCASRVSFCTSCSNVLDVTKNIYSLVCMSCQNEYYLNGSICSPCLDSINFCLLCSNNFQCQLCQAGYFLGSTLTCISCGELIAGCTACQSNSVCLSCAGGYYLINNYCTACQMAINSCFGCGRLNGTLTCSSCLQGSFLAANFTCLPCNASLQFCSACRNASACTACISGYTVSFALVCTPCATLLPYCQYCTTTCLKCIDNYLLDNYGECRSCSYYISGCGLCEYDFVNATGRSQLNCTACLTGYLGYLSGSLSKCVACNVTIPNCLACASLYVCNQCNNLSFINSKSTCSLCNIYLPNCLYCNTSDTCLVCLPSYYLNDKLTCEYCDVSHFGNDGSALRLSLCLNCKYMSGVAVCLSCIMGYYVSANGCASCVGAIANCLSCASNSLCIQCQSGYYLSSTNSQCLNCPPALTYCASCDLNGLCLQCSADCYLNSTSNSCVKCFQITPGCSLCDGNRTCLACSDGYYLAGLSCMSCAAIFKDCLLCSDSSACALYTSNYTVSTSNSNLLTILAANVWMYIAFACFAALALAVMACIVWRKCRSKEQRSEFANSTKGQTERQLYREEHESNDVRIGHGQLCQHCKSRPFNVMNIQLLCTLCEGRSKGRKDHIIRREVTKQQRKDSGLQGERMVRESSSERKKDSHDAPHPIRQASVGKSRQSEQFRQVSMMPKGKQTESEYAEPNERRQPEQPVGKPINKKVSQSIM